MLEDLKEVIASSKEARERLLAGKLPVKEANAVAAQNHNIIGAYALDLRERIFAADMKEIPALALANRVEKVARNRRSDSAPKSIGGNA